MEGRHGGLLSWHYANALVVKVYWCFQNAHPDKFSCWLVSRLQWRALCYIQLMYDRKKQRWTVFTFQRCIDLGSKLLKFPWKRRARMMPVFPPSHLSLDCRFLVWTCTTVLIIPPFYLKKNPHSSDNAKMIALLLPCDLFKDKPLNLLICTSTHARENVTN